MAGGRSVQGFGKKYYNYLFNLFIAKMTTGFFTSLQKHIDAFMPY